MIPRRWRKYIGHKPLPFEITDEPTRIDIERWTHKNPKKNYFLQIDDNKIVLNGRLNAGSGWVDGLLIFGAGALGTFLFGLTSAMTYDAFIQSDWMGMFGVIFTPVSAIYATTALYYSVGMFVTAVRYPETQIIFDRQNGMVTLPPISWGCPEIVPFQKLYVTKGVFIQGAGFPSHSLLAIRSDGRSVDISLLSSVYIPGGIGSDDLKRDWSFWVWYMQKHRKLPPGTAFDPHRARDRLRISEAYEKSWSKSRVEA